MKAFKSAGLSAVLLLVGCHHQLGYRIEDTQETRAYALGRDSARLACPEVSCQVVGRVHAHTRAPAWLPFLLGSDGALREALWMEAIRLGGTSVVEIRRFSRSQFEWREEHLVATAVRYLPSEGGSESP